MFINITLQELIMACSTISTWFGCLDVIIGISQAVFPPIIGLAVVYIAYQQHKTNRNKLRLDLYDRRFKLYNEITSLLSSIVQRGDVSNDDLMGCLRNTKEAVFLFKEDIPKYINELYTQATELQLLEKIIGNKIPDADIKKAIEKRAEIFGWFPKQFGECTEKFKKYLSFENVDYDARNWMCPA